MAVDEFILPTAFAFFPIRAVFQPTDHSGRPIGAGRLTNMKEKRHEE